MQKGIQTHIGYIFRYFIPIFEKNTTMFGDMMGKLQAMKEQMEESKKRLDNITVEGDAEGGKIKVVLTGNRKLKSVHIDPSLGSDTEELEDLLVIAFNRAMEKADNVNESEMQGAAKDFMPNLPGM